MNQKNKEAFPFVEGLGIKLKIAKLTRKLS